MLYVVEGSAQLMQPIGICSSGDCPTGGPFQSGLRLRLGKLADGKVLSSPLCDPAMAAPSEVQPRDRSWIGHDSDC